MKRPGLSIVVFFLSLTVYAIQWPVLESELLYGFGSPMEDGVSSGIGLKHSEESPSAVRPYHDGELIFMARDGYGLNEGAEGIVVLSHEDGFRSCYGRIEPERDLESRSYLEEDDSLGLAPEELKFAIRDTKLDQWVNPFFMFSVGEDSVDPTVESVILEKEGRRYSLADSSRLAAGSYRLLIKVYDQMERGGPPFLPYSVKIRYLGVVHFSLSLDSLVGRDGKSCFDSGELIEADGLFTDEGYLNGGQIIINQGKGLLEVELTDYRGNRTIRSFPLNRG
ncbi:MAG: hypothetical protein PQJ60_09560 [Spirochaetales bacterium]|nr:hypothetical protein [Spirochaetales bacterium]